MSENQNTVSDISSQESLPAQFALIKELFSEGNFDEARNLLSNLHSADLADLIDNSSTDQATKIFELIEDEIEPETLVELTPRSKSLVLDIYNNDIIAGLLKKLSSEDALDFISNISEERKDEILVRLPKDKRNEIIDSFNYSEGTAGRVMTRNFVKFYEHWSVGQAIDSIRSLTEDTNSDSHAAVIIDSKNKPVGTITLFELLKHKRNDPINTIMNVDTKLVSPETELYDLSYFFKQYALTVIPVVSKSGKVVGTVSIDNMVYIIDEQAEDAFLNLGGVYETDLYDNFTTAARHRFPWLFINLIAAYITSLIINNFGDIIIQMVTLASLMPVVASMGGNAATQTMAVTLIAITNKEIDKINSYKIIMKEFLTCSLNGVLLSVIGSIIVYLIFKDSLLAQVFGIAVFINFVIAGILGSSIPIILEKLNLDPAVSSGVILCAFTDSLGFLTFLALAQYLILF